MQRDVNEGDLPRLDSVRRGLVWAYWWGLVINHHYATFPFPMKLAVDIGLILMLLFWIIPMPPAMPPIGLLIAWAGAYCAAFVLAAFSPYKRHERFHWLFPTFEEQPSAPGRVLPAQWLRFQVRHASGRAADLDTGYDLVTLLEGIAIDDEIDPEQARWFAHWLGAHVGHRTRLAALARRMRSVVQKEEGTNE